VGNTLAATTIITTTTTTTVAATTTRRSTNTTTSAMAGDPQLAIFGWGQSQSRTRTCVTLLHGMGAKNHGKPILWISNAMVAGLDYSSSGGYSFAMQT